MRLFCVWILGGSKHFNVSVRAHEQVDREWGKESRIIIQPFIPL